MNCSGSPRDRTVRGALRIHVERGVNREIASVVVVAIVEHRVGKCAHGVESIGIGARVRSPFILCDSEPCLPEPGKSVGRDVARLDHESEYEVAASDCALRMASRRVVGWRLRKRREHCRLRQRYPVHAFPEKVAARRLHSVDSVTHVDRVQVELKDLVFRERPFHQAGKAELDELLSERAVRIFLHHEAVLRRLHRDSAEPFADSPGANVLQRRACEPAPVDAMMLVETAVFGGDEGLTDVHGNLRDGYIETSDYFDVSHEAPVAIVDAPPFVGFVPLNLSRRGASLEPAGRKPGIQHDDRENAYCERAPECQVAMLFITPPQFYRFNVQSHISRNPFCARVLRLFGEGRQHPRHRNFGRSGKRRCP